jgi:hypothetical protein
MADGQNENVCNVLTIKGPEKEIVRFKRTCFRKKKAVRCLDFATLVPLQATDKDVTRKFLKEEDLAWGCPTNAIKTIERYNSKSKVIVDFWTEETPPRKFYAALSEEFPALYATIFAISAETCSEGHVWDGEIRNGRFDKRRVPFVPLIDDLLSRTEKLGKKIGATVEITEKTAAWFAARRHPMFTEDEWLREIISSRESRRQGFSRVRLSPRPWWPPHFDAPEDCVTISY